MGKGLFISFEGCEGSGKTTQAEKLFSYLKKLHYDCLLTHEPGGTIVSEKIRRILLHHSNSSLYPLTELFLYLASRSQHTDELILPAIKKGTIVISDRYTDSSLAYQGVARNLSLELVHNLNRIATGGIIPDITFLIDIDPEKGLKRLKGKDRIENEEVVFHRKVREAYLNIAKKRKKRIKVINGEKSENVIFSEIIKITRLHPWFRGKLKHNLQGVEK
ncbi:MAG: dTMP kinase [Candidatus Cloacimonadota bacterium]|nr:MAG: dTMP kinase [Candidatus Cloacimonadota bacterium]